MEKTNVEKEVLLTFLQAVTHLVEVDNWEALDAIKCAYSLTNKIEKLQKNHA